MEKQILEMLSQLNERKQQMDSRMEKGFAEVGTKFVKVNSRLDSIDRKLDGIAYQFEESLKPGMAYTTNEEIEFLLYKINRLAKRSVHY